MEDKESKLNTALHSFWQKKCRSSKPNGIRCSNLRVASFRFRTGVLTLRSTMLHCLRRPVFVVIIVLTTFACSEQPQNDKSGLTIDGVPVATLFGRGKNGEAAVIQLNEERFDFDTLAADQVVEHKFRFSNAGDAPLLIASVKSTCGCTVPSWPEGVIEPGEFGDITVSFDAAGRSGRFIKKIQIRSNASPPVKSIRISGFIQPVS